MIGRARAGWERAGLVPALVRAGVFGAGLTALLVAAPPPLRATPLGLAGLLGLAALPALVPRGPWVTVVALATAAGWVLATERYGQPVGAARVLLLAGLLYLLHSLATLAGALPYDAVVAPEVVARWLTRALAVVAVASLLATAVLAGLAALAGDRAHVAATLAGLGLATGAAALLRLLAGRPPA